jgi:pimeloyl-ACP methyl ester carboxylesterase
MVPVQELAYEDSRWVELEGVHVHYRESGSELADVTFVLLHGFGASTFSWNDQLELLRDRGRVIAFDRPAFGLSERPMPGEWTGESPYSLEQNAHRTIELMDALNIRHAVLVGHSAGGEVAIAAAALYPDRVSGLVLEAPAVYSSGGPPEYAKPLMRTPQARRLGPLILRRLLTSRGDELVRSAYANPDQVTAETIEGYRRPLKALNWDRALWEFTSAPRTLSAAELIDEIRMPTLVITGDSDTFVEPEQTLRAYERITRPKRAPGDVNATVSGRFVELPDIGHIPHEESPQRFAEEVIAFLDRIDHDPDCPT